MYKKHYELFQSVYLSISVTRFDKTWLPRAITNNGIISKAILHECILIEFS